MKPWTTALAALAWLSLGVACGKRPPPEPHAPGAYTFSLGPMVLFELNEAAELADTAPRADESDWGEQASRNDIPRLSFNLRERVLARFAEPAEFRLSGYRPTAWSMPYPACAVAEPLQQVADILTRIAHSKDSHSRIPAALRTLDSCAMQATLTCFLRKLDATDWVDVASATQRGSALKSIVSSLSGCTGVEALWQTETYFEVKDGIVRFFPDPLVSVRIFAGEHTSYTWANDHLDSVGKLVDVSCSEGCFSAPLPLAHFFKCNSCQPLEAGKTYTAFLQIRPGEEEDSFRRVVFRAP